MKHFIFENYPCAGARIDLNQGLFPGLSWCDDRFSSLKIGQSSDLNQVIRP